MTSYRGLSRTTGWPRAADNDPKSGDLGADPDQSFLCGVVIAISHGLDVEFARNARNVESMSRFGILASLAVLFASSVVDAVPGYAASSASMTTPGPMAVTPAGTLYVASGREMYRFNGGAFTPVARSARPIESMASSRSGFIYLGEGNLLQVLTPTGTVTTVTHTQVSGLGNGPGGDIMVVSYSGVARLVGRHLVRVVRASQFAGLKGAPKDVGAFNFGNVAVNGSGDIFLSALGVGWSLYEVSRAGRARYVGVARGAGGIPSPLVESQGGHVFLGVQNSIETVKGLKILGFQSFSLGSVPCVNGTFAPAYLAASSESAGPIYADTVKGQGWSSNSAVIAVYPDHRVVTLWVHN